MEGNGVNRSFVDTNVWYYAFVVQDDPTKSLSAQKLIRHIQPVVSTQVIMEICANLLRKAKLSEDAIRTVIQAFFSDFVVVLIDEPILGTASRLRERYSLSFWDSTIVACALISGCSELYSEDMQHGLNVEGQLRIVNPFLPPVTN